MARARDATRFSRRPPARSAPRSASAAGACLRRRQYRPDGRGGRRCAGAGAPAVGIIPDALMGRELGHRGLTELVVVETMHERKRLMAERSDAFLRCRAASERSKSCSRSGPGCSSAITPSRWPAQRRRLLRPAADLPRRQRRPGIRAAGATRVAPGGRQRRRAARPVGRTRRARPARTIARSECRPLRCGAHQAGLGPGGSGRDPADAGGSLARRLQFSGPIPRPVHLAGPDAHHLLDRRHEDLAVADLARLGGLDDGLDAAVDIGILTTTSTFTLGRKSTTYSAPRYNSVWPF